MAIELDVTLEERRAQIIRNCGAKPIGERPEATDGFQSLCWFVDPVTKSTCTLPIEDVTEEKVRRKLIDKLKEFYSDPSASVYLKKAS